jgi:hypothetical protein
MDSCTDENRDDRGSNFLSALFVCLFACFFCLFVFFNVGRFSECMNSESYTAIIMARGIQIFDKSSSHLKILGARRATQH